MKFYSKSLDTRNTHTLARRSAICTHTYLLHTHYIHTNAPQRKKYEIHTARAVAGTGAFTVIQRFASSYVSLRHSASSSRLTWNVVALDGGRVECEHGQQRWFLIARCRLPNASLVRRHVDVDALSSQVSRQKIMQRNRAKTERKPSENEKKKV